MQEGGNLEHDRRNDGGFTLIELLIVIVILGVLAVVVVFAVGGVTNRGEASALAADERTVAGAQEAHYALHGTYATEDDLVAAGFLRSDSELVDIALSGGGSGYAITPVSADGGGGGGGGGDGGDGGDGGGGPTTTTVEPVTTSTLPPGPVVAYAGFTGQTLGSGSRTLVIIGNGGASTLALYSMLSSDPLPDTQVIWLDGNDLDTTFDVQTVIDAGPDYMVAADSVPITSPSGNTFVGIYMSQQLSTPNGFWWTHQLGNPTRDQLLSRLS